MKKVLPFVVLLFLCPPLWAQEAKLRIRDFTPMYTVSSFTVFGICGMCSRRILNAVKVDGVKSAFWDQDEQELTVQYNVRKIALKQIYQVVSAAGHDTETLKASNAVYAN